MFYLKGVVAKEQS